MQHQTPSIISSIILLLLVAVSGNTLAKNKAEPEVKDHLYELSLFDFYQGKYFSAINNIIVAKKSKKTGDNDKKLDLLLGDSYLSYGLPDHSSEVFSKIISQSQSGSEYGSVTPQHMLDYAWYSIGKNHYQNGLNKKAETAFDFVGDKLSDKHKAERLFMLTNIYTNTNRLNNASHVLKLFDKKSIWLDYATFNVGATLIKNSLTGEGVGQIKSEAGTQLLRTLAEKELKEPIDEERKILQDKANLALAYTSLRNNPIAANHFFEAVRLNNTESAIALLGIGWSLYMQSDFNHALTPWMELANREKSDPYVLEALVSIPAAFEKTNNNQQALYQYDLAIHVYQQQLSEARKVIDSIHNGDFIGKIKVNISGEESIKPFNVLFNINTASNQYLLSLVSSSEFHEALKSYQETIHLSHTLNNWHKNFPIMYFMLREKTKLYNEKLTGAEYKLKIEHAKKLQQHRDKLANRIGNIKKADDPFLLATNEENIKLKTLDRAKKIIRKNNLIEENEKQKFLYGLMYWEIVTGYKSRLQQIEKKLDEADTVLDEVNRSVTSLNKSKITAPRIFINQSKQIDESSLQIKKLKNKISTSLQQQEKRLNDMAIKVTHQQIDRLNILSDRATYERTRLYDTLLIKNSND